MNDDKAVAARESQTRAFLWGFLIAMALVQLLGGLR